MAWFYALLLFANSSSGVRTSFVRKQLGLGHRSSFRLCRMIRVHMATDARDLRGLVEPDKIVPPLTKSPTICATLQCLAAQTRGGSPCAWNGL